MARHAFAIAACLATVLTADALAQTDVAAMEGLMADYLKSWNKHDAATITRQHYRLPESHPWATEAGLKAEFDRLKGQGYSHSTNEGIKGCQTGADTGQVELRFTRLKTDGTAMPPGKRLSIYRLKKFEDGWKVVGMGAGDVVKGMDCPTAK